MNQISTPIRLNRSRSCGELDQRVNVGCLSTFSEGVSSETTAPIGNKFHMQPPSKWEKKVCVFCPGHMTKMANMPIYGKKP